MSWLQIRYSCSREQIPRVEQALLDVGASAVTLQDAEDQPIYEPGIGETPLWSHTRVVGLFEASVDTEQLILMLTAQLNQHFSELPAYQIEILEDKDWVREWMENYEPLRFGERLWVCPSWKEPPEPSAINLILDPGLAFGTGTHPTTTLCLEWLEAQDWQQINNLVDYGCGSGILAVAGLLLGANNATGVDTDPLALDASRQNTERNHINSERFPVYLPGQCPELKTDLMVANILAQPLIQLAPTLADLCKPGALLALSGILDEQRQWVAEAYEPWFDIDIKQHSKDGWCLITGRRR